MQTLPRPSNSNGHWHYQPAVLCDAAAAAAANYSLFKRSASTSSATDGRGINKVGAENLEIRSRENDKERLRRSVDFVRGGSVGNLLNGAGIRSVGGHSIESFLSGAVALHDSRCAENGKESLINGWERLGSGNIALSLWGSGAKLVQATEADRNTFSSKGSSRDWGSNGSQLTTTTLSTPTRYSNRRIGSRDDNSELPPIGLASGDVINKVQEKEDGTRVGFHLHPLLLEKEYAAEGNRSPNEKKSKKTLKNAESQTKSFHSGTKFFSGVGDLVGGIIGVRSITQRSGSKHCANTAPSVTDETDTILPCSNKRTVSFSNFSGKRKRRRAREHHPDLKDDGGFDGSKRTHSSSLSRHRDGTKHSFSGDLNVGGLLVAKSGVILERTTISENKTGRSIVPNSVLVLDNSEVVADSRNTPRSERHTNSTRGISIDRTSGEVRLTNSDRTAGHAQYQVTEYSFDQPDSPFDEEKYNRTENRGHCRRRCKYLYSICKRIKYSKIISP